MMEKEDALILLGLMHAKGIGPTTLSALCRLVLKSGASLTEVVNGARYLQSLPRGEMIRKGLQEENGRAQFLWDRLNNENIDMITTWDARYPESLKENLHNDAPPILFVRGNIDLLQTPGVSFSGSRKAMPESLTITRECVMQLLAKKVTIIGGYAAGIDMAAHTTALSMGGTTIFVLAEGIFQGRIKPEIRNLLTPHNHLWVSSFPPDQVWQAWAAMRRNATISALGKALILVESGVKGGSYNAGQTAMKMGIPLFVVDFSPRPDRQLANPLFLQKGARPIRKTPGGTPNIQELLTRISQGWPPACAGTADR